MFKEDVMQSVKIDMEIAFQILMNLGDGTFSKLYIVEGLFS